MVSNDLNDTDDQDLTSADAIVDSLLAHPSREYEKLWQYALRLLNRRAYPVSKLTSKLQQRYPDSPTAMAQVIQRLQDLGYLNDTAYAQAVISNRLASKPLGKQRLRQTLQQKQLPAKIVQETLQQFFTADTETTLCQTALKKYLRTHPLPQTFPETQKLVAYLLRRGFNYRLVRQVLDAELPALREDLLTMADSE
jgi:regulatory protein